MPSGRFLAARSASETDSSKALGLARTAIQTSFRLSAAPS